MKFVFGVAIGAFGMWAYQNGKLQSWMGSAPESVQQAWQPAAERLGQVANSDQVRNAASAVQDAVQQRSSDIARPSAAEVSGRPSEPLPTQGAYAAPSLLLWPRGIRFRGCSRGQALAGAAGLGGLTCVSVGVCSRSSRRGGNLADVDGR